MDKKIYPSVKNAAQVITLAGVIYFLASLITPLPNVAFVLGVILCVHTLATGALLFVGERYSVHGRLYDGEMDILENNGVKTFSLCLSTDPDKLGDQKEVSFKVNR